ncbi:universal stress protein [Algibacter pectinivorans]|uniref:Universal stress protein family protein n=1 Tax=Algibacter pectinivorans TaxID=870482 RepID=A0A1I1NXQ6_9FLAO|nr:universal stress protein [Algibacter pectinivorans]SFC98500.1 Universal stress protein family protein [Algibacter pectinivorans]
MKASKYKILVLSDLKKHTASTIKSAVGLAKMVDAEIDVFHVKKPTDVVASDSQLSAIRTINQALNQSKNKIEKLINPFIEDYNVNITFNYGIGNIKSEIETYIENTKPDCIVLGKRNTKIINLTGDHLTDFILKSYSGPVLIVSKQNGITPETDLHLGLLNGQSQVFNQDFNSSLFQNTSAPLKSFNIVNSKSTTSTLGNTLNENTVDFVFEKNDNTIKKIDQYLEQNKVNLLLINRPDNKGTKINNNSEIKQIINNVNVSLFITSNTP